MAKASSQEHILRQKEENDIEKTRQQPLENDMEKELKFWLLWIDGWIVRGDTSERLFADWKFAFPAFLAKKKITNWEQIHFSPNARLCFPAFLGSPKM